MENPLYYLVEGADRLQVNGVEISVPSRSVVRISCWGSSRYLKFTPVYPDENTALNESEMALIQKGDKLYAIKNHRSRTGLSLQISKEICDRYHTEWQASLKK